MVQFLRESHPGARTSSSRLSPASHPRPLPQAALDALAEFEEPAAPAEAPPRPQAQPLPQPPFTDWRPLPARALPHAAAPRSRRRTGPARCSTASRTSVRRPKAKPSSAATNKGPTIKPTRSSTNAGLRPS